jgi:hypothetical protein
MKAAILILPNWQLEFHVQIGAYLLAIGVMLAHNSIDKYAQPIVYASRLLNEAKLNYITLKKETLNNGLCFA